MKIFCRLLLTISLLPLFAGAGDVAALGGDPDARWAAGFAPTGCNGVVFDVAAGESGELYVGGLFSECGGVAVSNVARYEPSTGTFSALGSGGGNGVDDRVRALAVDGGDLYVGGEFLNANAGAPVAAKRIARWDGTAWSALGSGGGDGVDDTVLTLLVSGGDLYAGGNFDLANVGAPVTVNRIARWDGAAWSALGSGGGAGASSNVFALAELGGELYVGGVFQEVNVGDPVAASFIARWDGSSWSPLAADIGLFGAVHAFVVSGDDLYVGGAFSSFFQDSSSTVTNRVARWDGTAFSALGTGTGTGVGGSVADLEMLDGDLYVIGSFPAANLGGLPVPSTNITRWDGASWSAVGSDGGEGFSGSPNSAAVAGGVLYVGGGIERANLGGEEVVTRRLAAWDGVSWSPVAPSGGVAPRTPTALPTRVDAVAVSGDVVYFGGFFHEAGGVPANNIVAYDRTTGTWSALGSPGSDGNGTNVDVRALLVDGEDLYVGGAFTEVNAGDGITANRVARWDGTAWHALEGLGGEGLDGQVEALAKCGGDLYVGGLFLNADVGDPIAARRIARWDGAAWHALGSGGGNGVSSSVYALACAGDDLIVGGAFINANDGDPVTTYRIARWDGTAWHALGSDGGVGLGGFVYALAVSGDEIYAGGTFTTANIGIPSFVSAHRVARWDGAAWSSLGGGLDSTVRTLLLDGGELYVGGDFTQANAQANVFSTIGGSTIGGSPVDASRLAHWTGSDWAPLAGGVDGDVSALALATPDLLAVGGEFAVAGGKLSSRVGFYETRGTLTLSIDAPSGSVVSTPPGIACPGACSADFAWDTPITLTATPDPGYFVESFTGACDGDGPCVVRLSEDAAVGVSFALAQEADLSISIADAQDPLPAGVPVVYTVEVTNLAPLFQASGVTVSGNLPAGLTLVATDGCLEDPAGLPTCTLGDLAAGATASFTVEAAVDPAAGDMALFELCVAGADPDPQQANDCATETTALDLVAPQVDGVAVTGAAGTASLGGCDTVRREVATLQVSFSEALVAAGPLDPTSVENPANYRLSMPATGADFDTVDCQSAAGGDTVIAIDAVAWDAGARVASLVLDAARLEDGLHRLLVCGTLEDEVGNALDGGAGAGSDFARTFRVDARNLIADGHFDRYDAACGLGAWTSSDLGQVEIGSEDVEGSPLSGSAHNVSAAAGLDLGQCVELDGNGLYTLTAGVRVDGGSEDGGDPVAVELFCQPFDAAACAGASLVAAQLATSLDDTAAAFEALELEIETPSGTASALCGIVADGQEALAFDLYLDRVSLAVLPLFADGFESGGTSAWSDVVP